jgi:hypothetical protein
VESVRSTRADKITGDEYKKGDTFFINYEMQNIRNQKNPWWRPPINLKSKNIDLSSIHVITSMEDHVSAAALSVRLSMRRCTAASARSVATPRGGR